MGTTAATGGAQRTPEPPPSSAHCTCGHRYRLPALHRWARGRNLRVVGTLGRGVGARRRAVPRVGGALARARRVGGGGARGGRGGVTRADADPGSGVRCWGAGRAGWRRAAGGGRRGDLLFFAKSEPERAAEAVADGERESEREREESACPRGAAARPRPPRDAR